MHSIKCNELSLLSDIDSIITLSEKSTFLKDGRKTEEYIKLSNPHDVKVTMRFISSSDSIMFSES
ncbi:hypothetical protein D3C71_1950510 [compost metagenome]